MGYVEKLRESAEKNGSIVCMGMDPVLEKIPISRGDAEKKITKFYTDILDAAESENAKPGILKPNYAFYAQYGFPGLRALENVMKYAHKKGLMVIMDGKRADIGKTSAAYAKEAFDFWKADSVTLAPYMGKDSLMPFIEQTEKGKGVYILVRTSNMGALDIQSLKVDGKTVFMKTAEKVAGDWHKPGVGAVVGATAPKELEEISKFFVSTGKEVPLLIPGVGAQGGTAQEVVSALKKSGNDLALHRINSSSGLNYAYEKYKTDDYAGAAVKAIKELNREIGFT
ncbi:orotidine-5'-phosphate decarboxylase [Candidatus Woesearchaeota archaeon]|nr:orotidine-5'-phosphate decarboxylase [Candidatus Woesearchaeota archaeon]